MHIVMHMLVLAEFCIEVFDGGKCQRQHYFSFISGIVAQFFNVNFILYIFSQARGQNFAAVKAEVVAQGTFMSTNTPHVTLKSPEMIGNKS